ncbi:MAG TPA: hypothetical protein VLH19_02010 [Patescibacteria group bacterium]|nr:hypothetical protein [Patescibacteria group bacterium]
MSKQTVENLQAASLLYEEAIVAQLDFGCLEISLQALGAPMSLVDLLNQSMAFEGNLYDIVSLIMRKGLELRWMAYVPADISGKDVSLLLDGDFYFPDPRPRGSMTGYLLLEEYPFDLEKDNHASAIVPRQLLPKSARLSLKKDKAYLMVDINSGGVIAPTAEQIAHYVRQVAAEGGRIAVSEVWKRERASGRG